jgi:hypothetical protein
MARLPGFRLVWALVPQLWVRALRVGQVAAVAVPSYCLRLPCRLIQGTRQKLLLRINVSWFC